MSCFFPSTNCVRACLKSLSQRHKAHKGLQVNVSEPERCVLSASSGRALAALRELQKDLFLEVCRRNFSLILRVTPNEVRGLHCDSLEMPPCGRNDNEASKEAQLVPLNSTRASFDIAFRKPGLRYLNGSLLRILRWFIMPKIWLEIYTSYRCSIYCSKNPLHQYHP